MNRRDFFKTFVSAAAIVAASPILTLWQKMTREIQDTFPTSAGGALDEFVVALGHQHPDLWYPQPPPAISASDVRRRVAELEAERGEG